MKAIILALGLALVLGALCAHADMYKEWEHSNTHTTTRETHSGNTMTRDTTSTTTGTSFGVSGPDPATAGAAAGAVLGDLLMRQQKQAAPPVQQPAAPAASYGEAPTSYGPPADTSQGDVTVAITGPGGVPKNITLKRANPGFIGPDNEYYPVMPDKSYLEQRYGQ